MRQLKLIVFLSLLYLTHAQHLLGNDWFNSVETSVDLDKCVELSIDCIIRDGNRTISCEEFSSNAIPADDYCPRVVKISAAAKNIFHRSIALSYQVDGSSATVELTEPGNVVAIGPLEKVIDVCKNAYQGNNDDIEVVKVEISSGYRIDSSPLQRCEDVIQKLMLKLPTAPPTPTPTVYSSNIPSKTKSSTPTAASSKTPTQAPTKVVSTRPSLPPLNCVGLEITCLVQDENGGFVICEELASQPLPTSDSCQRVVYISARIINILPQTVSISFRIDRSSATTIIQEKDTFYTVQAFEKIVDVCPDDKTISDVEVFGISIFSRFQRDSSIQTCVDIDERFTITLPKSISSSPSKSPVAAITPSPMKRPTRKPATPITISPSESPTYPVTPPTTRHSVGPSLSPSTTTKSPFQTAQPSQECYEFQSKGGKGKTRRRLQIIAKEKQLLPTKSPNNIPPTVKATEKQPLPTKSPNNIPPTGKVTEKQTLPTESQKLISPSGKGKGKIITTKSPKKSKGKNRKCKKSKGECNKKKSKEKRKKTEKGNKMSVHFSGTAFSDTSTISAERSSIIMDDLNVFFTGGAQGCDISMQETLQLENIVSLEFTELLIADENMKIDGLDDFCDEIPEEFSGSECTEIAGTIEVLLDERSRRLLTSDKEERIFQVVKELLDNYADTASEDIDLVVGMRYRQLQRQAFVSSALGTSSDNELKWEWYMPALIVGVIIVTIVAFQVIRVVSPRSSKTIDGEVIVNDGDTAALFAESNKNRSKVQFPLCSMQVDNDGILVEVKETAYDFEVIGSPVSLELSDEIAIQRAQLMNNFVMPTAVGVDYDDGETDAYWTNRKLTL